MDDLYKSLLASASIFLLGGLLSLIVARLTKVILGRLAKRTKSKTDDFIVEGVVNTIKPLGWVISASLAWSALPVPEEITNAVLGITKLICLILLVRLINKVICRVTSRWCLRIDDESVSTMIKSLDPMIRALIWCVGFVFYLQNMGVQMTAIWALLSAGGIGAGLALKEPVQEFFEYITILLDKPFQNGQFINAGEIWATVEKVGVRSTRLRSVNGEVIVVSNSKLTNGVIANYAEMEYRRLVHKLGVIYDTPLPKVKLIPKIIESIIDEIDDVIFDRCHFTDFGEFSLDFEMVYFVPTNNYLQAMEAQQAVNFEVMSRFQKENIEFAFPTQTIHLSGSDESKTD